MLNLPPPLVCRFALTKSLLYSLALLSPKLVNLQVSFATITGKSSESAIFADINDR
uniref:Candidate secreted effector n=1 Tax=Meloidogyne incognita TaxID=6306 RepID=A0A914NDJ2_MELIC